MNHNIINLIATGNTHDIKIRAGYQWKYNTYTDNTITGSIFINLQNGKVFERTMEWDSFGNSTNKEKYPTEYYYDLVYKPHMVTK